MMNMIGLTIAAGSFNAMIIYRFRYQIQLPWHRVIGRMCTISAIFTILYHYSPGYRRYSKFLNSRSN